MATFDHNSDGTTIVKLDSPVTVNGESIDRLTIPQIKGRHLKQCPFRGGDVTIGQLIEFASQIVLPLGSVDELTAKEATQVASEVATLLSKSS